MISDQNMIFALGLAQKAGKAASGDYAVKSALKGRSAKLLIIAGDIAENSKKDLVYLANENNVPIIETLDRQRLGLALGKAQRSAVVIIDNNFVKMMYK